MDHEGILAVERLAQAAAGKTVEIGGLVYSTTPLHDPRRQQPIPATLALSTLSSFVDYAKSKHDLSYRGERGGFVHVVGPTRVRLCTGVFGEFNQRVDMAQADAIVPRLTLDSFLDPETFNIMLQAHFVATEGRSTALAIVGNLAAEAVQTVADDGMSQSATMRAGVVRVSTTKIPNPIVLRPFRAFSEVEQVDSPFVLRLRGGGDGKFPACALFESDGGMWRIEATARVKNRLADALDGVCAVYG